MRCGGLSVSGERKSTVTKKNKSKLTARARQAKFGGKYQHHLRVVRGIGEPPKPVGFFEAIMKAIGDEFPHASLKFADEINRLDVTLGQFRFAFLTPHDVAPRWPVTCWNESRGQRPGSGWSCENIDDILTVLRWPKAKPSGADTDVNELRDDYENSARHVWGLIGGNAVRTLYECAACKAQLDTYRDETPEEIAHIGYANWRRREAGTLAQNPSALSRSAEVGFISPYCPGTTPIIVKVQGLIKSFRKQQPERVRAFVIVAKKVPPNELVALYTQTSPEFGSRRDRKSVV